MGSGNGVRHMKTVILKVENKRTTMDVAHEVFPVRITIDGQEICDEIPADEILIHQKDLVTDPGRFRGRELTGSDAATAAGGEEGVNAQFARWLHGLVFGSKLAAAWTDLRKAADDGFRLVLDIEPREMRRLRWEQIGAEAFYPALHAKCAVVRGRYNPAERVPLRDGPLRILLVVGSKQGDTGVLAEMEVEALQQRLDNRIEEVEIKILQRPRRAEVVEHYLGFKPHVFHFIGHGMIDPSSTEPCLALYDVIRDEIELWRSADIISDLGRHTPAFVFLNACHTIDAAENSPDLEAQQEQNDAQRRESSYTVYSMSDAFLKFIGARGMLGMHSAVKGDSAGYLAARLYEGILAEDDLDVALNQARITVDQHRGVDSSRVWDWALPYLRVTVSPDQVLGMAPVISRLKSEATQVNEFRNSANLVGQVDQRRQFLSSMQLDRIGKSNLVLVTGERNVGKTALICRCLEWMARRGRPLKYVRLGAGERVDALGLLRAICQGRSDSLIDRPLPLEAMTGFYQVLNATLAGADSSLSSQVAEFPVEPRWDDLNGKARLLPTSSRSGDSVEPLFRAFSHALESVPASARKEMAKSLEPRDSAASARVLADQRPFLIVIDGLSLDSVDVYIFRLIFVPRLLRPIASGISANVLFILSVDERDLDPLGLAPLSQFASRVDVHPHSADEFDSLAELYFDKLESLPENRTKNLARGHWADVTKVVGQHMRAKGSVWKPEVLDFLWKMVFLGTENGGTARHGASSEDDLRNGGKRAPMGT
jgi:CHAT domain